jgi:glycosyltransferase involved in cell wall biosynthesis
VKILLVHNFYRITGGECHAVRSQQRLLEKKGHRVILYSAHSSDLEQTTALNRLAAATRVRGNNRVCRDLQRVIREEKPDLAHVHNVFPILSPKIYPTLKQLGVPVVQTIHNLRLICPGGFMFTNGNVCEKCLHHSLNNAVIHRCVQGNRISSLVYADAIHRAWRKGWFPDAIDRYLVLNNFFGEQLTARGIARSKQRVLPNFVEIPDTGHTAKKPYVLFLGRLSPEKGIHTLLEAWSELDGITLKIAGAGELEPLVKEQAAGRLKNRIEFLGYVEAEEKTRLLREAMATVTPSTWYENCPISVLESLAAGTPALVTSMGGLPDLVRHGKDGFVFPPENSTALNKAVTQLRDNPSLVTALSANAFASAKDRFSPNVHYRGLMNIYGELLENKSSAPTGRNERRA